jgi:hypothetical protein
MKTRRRTAALQCLAWITLMLVAMALAEPMRAESHGPGSKSNVPG